MGVHEELGLFVVCRRVASGCCGHISFRNNRPADTLSGNPVDGPSLEASLGYPLRPSCTRAPAQFALFRFRAAPQPNVSQPAWTLAAPLSSRVSYGTHCKLDNLEGEYRNRVSKNLMLKWAQPWVKER